METWLPIDGYEGFYSVSDLGRVRSERRVLTDRTGRVRDFKGRILRNRVSAGGYHFVTLSRDCDGEQRRVHHLVLEAFVGPRPEDAVACHDDGNVANNALSNLRWDTQSQNIRDQVRHGTHNMTSREECQFGHQLAAPNLVASVAKRGRRDCLACSRGRARVAYYQQKRGVTLDLRAESDAYYQRIMTSDAGQAA